MTFFSSVTIALRPTFMRSASAMSSGDARSTCGVTSVAILFIRSPSTPNTQAPIPNHSQFPTPNSQQLPIGNWELGVVGRWALAVGSLFPLCRADLSRLQRNCRDQLLEFRRILRRVHALLEQSQRLHPPLEIASLDVQRAQLGIRGQPIVAGDAERQHRRHLAVLVLRIAA